jgi:hypothetical protein
MSCVMEGVVLSGDKTSSSATAKKAMWYLVNCLAS